MKGLESVNRKSTKRPLVLISVMIAMFVSAIEATIVTTAMPTITSELGGFTRYSWIFSAYMLMSTVTVLIYGKLADIFGRKPIFFIGVSIFLIGSFVCGLATSMEQLIIFRLLQGLGAGAVMPIATTIVGDMYTLEERAKIQGYLSSVWGISAVLGPAIGGLIVQYFHWKYIFWVNVPLGLLAMLGGYLFLHEPKRSKPVVIDYKGAISLMVSLSLLLIWLIEGGQSFQRISLSSFFLVVIGIGVFMYFIQTQKVAKDPMMPFQIWKNPLILYANIVSLTTGIILIGVSSYLPTYVSGIMEKPAIVAGFALTSMSIGWPIASSVAGHLLIRFGPFPVSLIGGFSLLAGSGMLLVMNVSLGPIWAGFASFFIGIGMGLTSTSFIVSIQAAVPRENRGSATAANMFMRNLGNTLGAAILGAVLNASLVYEFSKNDATYSVKDVNLLLTEEVRRTISPTMVSTLQRALEHSLQWVHFGIALFAFISLVILLKIPRGKVSAHDNN